MPTLTFRIDYATTSGWHLVIDLRSSAGEALSLPLHTTDGYTWETTFSLSQKGATAYGYRVVDAEGHTLRSTAPDAFLLTTTHEDALYCYDRWPQDEEVGVFRHTPFALPRKAAPTTSYLRLQCAAPLDGYDWAVVGDSKALGQWDPARAVPLQCIGPAEWGASLSADDIAAGVAYKYILCRKEKTGQPEDILWEEGDNRHLLPTALFPRQQCIVTDDAPRLSTTLQQRLRRRGAGVVIPVFSLRSKGSQGIGDFGDLIPLIHWARQTGMTAIQLLPINDTTSTGTARDSYPYNGISVFALHPIYLDLREWDDLPEYEDFRREWRPLNEQATVDYATVFTLKMRFLATLYRRQGTTVRQSAAYRTFCRTMRDWLDDYCLYRVDHRDEVAALPAEAATPDFFRFTQYLLHTQMTKAHRVARECGILLKGDIPIGVHPHSVCVATHPELFHTDGAAGAPPDDFARHGQNWGFPTYNWENMARDNYQWWRRRLQHMERYFDAYRIDHVLGFFRIWEIPTDQADGRLGHFRPALPFSAEEIHAAGFIADISLYTTPFLTTSQRTEWAAEFPNIVWDDYFQPDRTGRYRLRAPWNSGSYLLQHLPEGKWQSRLLELLADVLFLEDKERKGYYHPRISGAETTAYHSLTEHDRRAFDRLHEDFFYHRHNDFWAQEALRKLPAIVRYHTDETPTMLPCAEDLGMIPASVGGVLKQWNILSLEIQRMPKRGPHRFAAPANNPYLSVATIATHDMPPLRLWWKEDKTRAEQFYHEALHHEGPAPEEATPELCRYVVANHLASPSMLCLLALQDYLSIDEQLRRPTPEEEQINVPADPHHVWNYRMHLTLETLLAATDFNRRLQRMMADAGRTTAGDSMSKK